jgi:methionyl-tRNA formyltransferase
VKLAFLGTSRFACPALAALAERHEVALVVTQPDRPVGRHARLQPPPVREAADRLGLPVFQPERINVEPSVERLRAALPEAIVVAAYGQLLKPAVFRLAPLGTINIHASLLPAYRGAAPIPWAILRGERTTGITTFLIDAGMDTGAMLLQRPIDIGPDETAGELEDRLAQIGADLVLETLDGLYDGSVHATAQPKEGISTAPPLSREDGRIDWTRPASEIHDLIRGTNPWPGAWTELAGQRIKLHRSSLTGIACGRIRPGEIGLRETDRLLVGTGDRLIELLELQRQGRPRTSGADFLHGLRGSPTFT